MSIHIARPGFPQLPYESVIKHMLLPLRRCARRISPLSIAALAASLCLLSPTAASAHAKAPKQAHLESGVSGQSSAAPLQVPTAEPPAATDPPPESSTGTPPTESSTGTPAAETSANPRNEERRARRNAQAQTGCSVSLEATAPTITAGAPLGLVGTLSCPEAASAASQTVTLYQKVAHVPGFSIAATTTTEANGAFRFAPSGVEINSVFYVRSDGAKSAHVSVKVTPQVTIDAPAAGTQLLVGAAHTAGDSPVDSGAVTFTGTVSPADAGATVALQREYRGEAWHHIGVGQVNAEGGYSIAHTFFRAGEATIRVVVHSHGLYMNSASAPVTYQISRRRSRKVTIQVSADPIAYGLGVTISGIVAGADDQPVTLLAQTPEGTFAPLASGVTGSGGEYSFLESPLQTTRYRVTSASASSANLSEGVTYALTPTPSAATVQAGEPIAFTGTVTPAHQGQPVALEQQYASGLGYHAIATGVVSSGSTYSIAHTFTGAGAELLRIRVQEDAASPQIQGVASAAFKLEVTPAA